jgi:hypothetical protein
MLFERSHERPAETVQALTRCDDERSQQRRIAMALESDRADGATRSAAHYPKREARRYIQVRYGQPRFDQQRTDDRPIGGRCELRYHL